MIPVLHRVAAGIDDNAMIARIDGLADPVRMAHHLAEDAFAAANQPGTKVVKIVVGDKACECVNGLPEPFAVGAIMKGLVNALKGLDLLQRELLQCFLDELHLALAVALALLLSLLDNAPELRLVHDLPLPVCQKLLLPQCRLVWFITQIPLPDLLQKLSMPAFIPTFIFRINTQDFQ